MMNPIIDTCIICGVARRKTCVISVFFSILCFFSAFLLFSDDGDEQCFINATAKDGASVIAVAAEFEGKSYVFCSVTALIGLENLALCDTSGRALSVSKFELADDRDIARISVNEKLDKLLSINHDPSIGMPMKIHADLQTEKNSLEEARVTALGLGILEISSKLSENYLGAALTDSSDKLVGFCFSPVPELSMNSKEQVITIQETSRQIASKFDKTIVWKEGNLKSLMGEGKAIADARKALDSYVAVVDIWGKDPYSSISMDETPVPELAKWIEHHNDLVKNYPEYITKILDSRNPDKKKSNTNVTSSSGKQVQIVKFNSKDDPVPCAALIQKLQKAVLGDSVRLKTYPASTAKSLEMKKYPSSFLQRHSDAYAEIYRYVEHIVACKAKALPYLDPAGF